MQQTEMENLIRKIMLESATEIVERFPQLSRVNVANMQVKIMDSFFENCPTDIDLIALRKCYNYMKPSS